jgi:hypothetical protein
MKQFAKVMQNNALMQILLQSRVQFFVQRKWQRCRNELQKWIAEIGGDSRAVVDTEANAEREIGIARIQYKISRGDTWIRRIGAVDLCDRGNAVNPFLSASSAQFAVYSKFAEKWQRYRTPCRTTCRYSCSSLCR